MARKTILLTGGTGFVGYANILEALRAGYKVRAAIRREASIAKMGATKSVQPYLSSLTFVMVQDMNQEGAFDEAVKGVDYIVHIASPLPRPSDDDQVTIIEPAIRGTVGILTSAAKEPSVKRIVITSSLAAIVPSEAYSSVYETVLDPSSRVPNRSGPYSHFAMAYSASKVAALNATLDFVATERPAFDVINVLPTYVIGKNELATTKQAVLAGTNGLVIGLLFSAQNPAGRHALTVHVDDVAFLHVAALDPKIEGNQSFGAHSHGIEGVRFDDALEIVKRRLPKEVEEDVFPLAGSLTAARLRFDASRTEEVFGLKFKTFEEQIVSVAGWYAEATANESRSWMRANALKGPACKYT